MMGGMGGGPPPPSGRLNENPDPGQEEAAHEPSAASAPDAGGFQMPPNLDFGNIMNM